MKRIVDLGLVGASHCAAPARPITAKPLSASESKCRARVRAPGRPCSRNMAEMKRPSTATIRTRLLH
jgi:hypothetical protein